MRALYAVCALGDMHAVCIVNTVCAVGEMHAVCIVYAVRAV